MCCMAYEGVNYHYAFEFDVLDNITKNEIFRIIISKYRKEYKDFSGLCLNNELKIISHQEFPVAAFFDIVNKIVNYTISDRRAYFEIHKKIPQPLRSVKDEKIIEEFEKRKKSDESLFYYKKLIDLFEKQKRIIENIPEKMLSLEDFLNLMYFRYYLGIIMPNIKIRKAFTI